MLAKDCEAANAIIQTEPNGWDEEENELPLCVPVQEVPENLVNRCITCDFTSILGKVPCCNEQCKAQRVAASNAIRFLSEREQHLVKQLCDIDNEPPNVQLKYLITDRMTFLGINSSQLFPGFVYRLSEKWSSFLNGATKLNS